MIELRELQVTAGRLELGPIDLRIEPGEYAVLVGPTGSGKTTLVEAVAGLRPLASGQVCLGGVDVTRHRPADRRVGYVPQDSVLFPMMTVRDNLAFGLTAQGVARRTAADRVAPLADRLGIAPLLDRCPTHLSGGERGRVALGRALAPAPDILLLDEPLSSLDAPTQQTIRELLKELHAERGFTALHVSHQQEDVSVLAECVLAIRDGAIVAASNAAGYVRR